VSDETVRADIPKLPDLSREKRLHEIRREAESRGSVSGTGVRPLGAPFPKASPETGYYGIPLLKKPAWTWEIPLYFFVGGASGAAAVVGAIADYTGADRKLVRDARWIAAAGSIISPVLLVSDLGRPERFLAMLRVFKPKSPMSVGVWTLLGFSGAAAATAFATLVRDRYGPSLPIRVLENAGQAASLAFGLPFSNYTGVLIGATSIPVWNQHAGDLPLHFGFRIESQTQPVHNPLKAGLSGFVTRSGGALSGPVPALLRTAGLLSRGKRSRSLRRWAARSAIAGSLLTRIAWIQAGHASARNWRQPLEIPEPLPPTEN
jgi:Polysulphide reductase, NrfD